MVARNRHIYNITNCPISYGQSVATLPGPIRVTICVSFSFNCYFQSVTHLSYPLSVKQLYQRQVIGKRYLKRTNTILNLCKFAKIPLFLFNSTLLGNILYSTPTLRPYNSIERVSFGSFFTSSSIFGHIILVMVSRP